jgi:membrane protease YdiL (CAAX protease family)
MKNNLTVSTETQNLIAYFILAYAISWAIGVPLALGNQGLIHPIFPAWTHYFVAYGPMLSALIVTWASRGRTGLKELGKRMVMWKIRPIWWYVALSPLIIGLVVGLILNIATDNKVTLSALGQVHFLPSLGIGALFLWIFTFGIGEEVGWRGYALPHLQKDHSAIKATLILAVLWALWHLPQFFYLFDPSMAVGWAVGLLAGAIVFTWLFNSSSGSILIVAIWHGCFNFMSASNAGNGILAAVVSTIVMIWAVVVILIFKSENLSDQDKITG